MIWKPRQAVTTVKSGDCMSSMASTKSSDMRIINALIRKKSDEKISALLGNIVNSILTSSHSFKKNQASSFLVKEGSMSMGLYVVRKVGLGAQAGCCLGACCTAVNERTWEHDRPGINAVDDSCNHVK